MEPKESIPINEEVGEEELNGKRYSNRTLDSFCIYEGGKGRRRSRFPSFVPKEYCFSEFGDSESGEPMSFQRIRIDFSPIKDLDDNEALVTKCLDFWKVIEEHPEIQKLEVLPTLPVSSTIPSTGTTSVQMPSTEAVEWLGKEKQITQALGTKLSHKFCDLNHETYEPMLLKKDFGTYNPMSHCTDPLDTCNVHEAKTTDSRQDKSKSDIKMRRHSTNKFCSRSSLINLCQEMEHWDLKHPKTMDPPCHSSLPPHPILQEDC